MVLKFSFGVVLQKNGTFTEKVLISGSPGRFGPTKDKNYVKGIEKFEWQSLIVIQGYSSKSGNL